MGITIKDVAKKSGVSATTVSLVLNDKWEENRISEKTRQRIEHVAAELNYRSGNQKPPALPNKQLSAIGLIISDDCYYDFADTIKSMERACRNANFHLLTSIAQGDAQEKMESLSTMLKAGVEGVLFDPFSANSYHETIDNIFSNSALPIISTGSIRAQLFSNSISPDHRHGGYVAANHLLQLGHRKLLCVMGYAQSEAMLDFYRGCREALHEYNLSDENFLVSIPEFDFNYSRDLIARIQATGITAVITNADPIACGIMQAARQQGLHIPNDLSVIGYGNHSATVRLHLPCTTISLHFDRIARKAIHMIQKYSPDKSPVSPEIVIPTLIDRGSTAPSRV